MIPEGYKVEKTKQPVQRVDPELITRFRFRANRRCKKANKRNDFPGFRYEVHTRPDGKWAVVAMQNRLVPIQ